MQSDIDLFLAKMIDNTMQGIAKKKIHYCLLGFIEDSRRRSRKMLQERDAPWANKLNNDSIA